MTKSRHESCKGDRALVNLIAAAMRKVWHRHANREAVIKAAHYTVQEHKKDGTPKASISHFWTCALCGQACKQTASSKYPRFHVDHIDPVIPIGREVSWDEYIERLFFSGRGNLQVLCTNCHSTKTKSETSLRAEVRRKAK